MRSLLIALAATFLVAACSSQTTTPAASANAAPAAAAKAPQCYNGDASKFVDVGTTANISGVMVKCEATADGKAAQWMGKKH
jgi:hypothetical protein